jgi:5-methyltetrahydropteroyltriglutamate--homocysteine methyltransferase
MRTYNMTSTTDEDMFETFVVGSLPRPQWIRDLIEDRKFGRINATEADHLLDDSIPLAIRMQERAGLNYVSDGEWRRESYVKVFANAVTGFENDLIVVPSTQFSGLTYPAVVSKLVPRQSIATSEAKFLRAHTDRKTIVAIPSPYTIGRRMWSQEYSTKAYPTREEFMDACIPIIRNEIQDLVDLGVEAIQLDDPWLALLVDPSYRDSENITNIDHEIELSVKCANEATAGIENVHLSVHMCHAHFNRQHGTKGPYNLIIGALKQMNVDRFAMELATPDSGGLEALKDFPVDKILGLGVVDHTDTHVETPQEIVERTERAMEFVPKQQITLNPDCGFAPSSSNPMDIDESYLKLKAMCDGAELLREKYG